MMRGLFLLCFFLSGAFLFAQDDLSEPVNEETVLLDEVDELDSLFDTAKDDIIVESSVEIDHRTAYEKAETVDVKGSFSASAIVAAGWTNWNFSTDIGQGFDGSAGLTSTSSITFDARPAPEFRVYGNLSAAFNPLSGDISWGSISISELYCDYILKDFLYTRLGKHAIGWGQGRMFNPGNLMHDSASTYNVRLSVPEFLGLTFAILTNGATSYQNLIYSGKFDFILADTMVSPALRYNLDEGFTGLLSLKRVMFKTDFLLDLTAEFKDSFQSTYAVAGFFREWSDVKLYGEYQFSWTSPAVYTNDAGLALGINNPLGAPFDMGIQIIHNFQDWSGSVTFGITQKIWPYVNMNIGVPIIYGGDSSSAVLNNEDPSGRRIALVLALELSGSF